MKSVTQAQGGYVFVLALVTIAVLALGMIGTANLVQANLLRTSQAKDYSLSNLEALSQRNRVLFSLIEELDQRSPEFGPAAFELQSSLPSDQSADGGAQNQIAWSPELLGQRLDTPTGLRVTVLDHTGLIDLNARNDNYLAHVAEVLGIDSPRSAVDALRDFTDKDSLKRASGAEQSSYPASVHVPNAPLRAPEDICEVMYWRDAQICRNALLRSRLMVAGEGHFIRFRTASAEVRDLLLPQSSSDERSQQTVEWVRQSEILGFFDLALLGGQSGPRYTIIVEDPKLRRFRRDDALIAPGDSSRPFEVLQSGVFSSSTDPSEGPDQQSD